MCLRNTQRTLCRHRSDVFLIVCNWKGQTLAILFAERRWAICCIASGNRKHGVDYVPRLCNVKYQKCRHEILDDSSIVRLAEAIAQGLVKNIGICIMSVGNAGTFKFIDLELEHSREGRNQFVVEWIHGPECGYDQRPS